MGERHEPAGQVLDRLGLGQDLLHFVGDAMELLDDGPRSVRASSAPRAWPSPRAKSAKAVIWAVNVLVAATPISGPAWV